MANRLPSGTVTFVFTDIEGSTALLRRLGGAYAGVLADHHAILDRCAAERGGIRMSDEGDAGFFVFPTTDAAVKAARSWTAAIDTHPWPQEVKVKVRTGIHRGEALLVEGRRYVGLAVHLAARIAASGHGGQILVSAASTPHRNGMIDLGRHLFAGFPTAVGVLQASPGTFPPLRSQTTPSSIPAPTGSFVGREDEVADLASLIESHRLVTVLGPGGTGKTRLSCEVARRLGPAGGYFVDLTSIADPALMPSRVAAAIGMAEEPEADPVKRLAVVLGRSRSLLVLDNCEHLLEDAAVFVNGLLGYDPSCRVLATSRSPLGVPGERLFPLGPLDVEASTGGEAPATRLFLDRAAKGPVDPADHDLVAEICRRLDGLPLAIELAASMTRMMPLARLTSLLTDRIDMLSGGPGRPDRHRSLTAVVEWSVSSLSAPVRSCFHRLGVMSGPFTLDDASAVAEIDIHTTVRVVSDLVDRSLVVPHLADATYSMLETIRWFAHGGLTKAAEVEGATRGHTRHFRSVAVDARREMQSVDAIPTLDRLWPVRSNLLAVLERALDTGDTATAIDIVEGLVDAWAVRAAASEARLITARVLEAVAAGDPALEARALVARIEVRQTAGVGLSPQTDMAERLLDLARTLGDRTLEMRAEVWMSAAGRADIDHALAALSELETSGDERAVVYARQTVGWMWWWLDRPAEAMAEFERLYRFGIEKNHLLAVLDGAGGLLASVRRREDVPWVHAVATEVDELAERAGAGWWEWLHLQWMAGPTCIDEELDRSAEWLERAHRVAVERGTTSQVAFVTADQATNAWSRGDMAMANEKLVEFADTYRQIGEEPLNPFLPEMAAAVAAGWGMHETAARLLGAGRAWRLPGGLTDNGMPMPGWDEPRHTAVVGAVIAALGEGEYLRLSAEGAALPRTEVIRVATQLG